LRGIRTWEDQESKLAQTSSTNSHTDAIQVIGSFAVVAWFTVILTLIPAWKETKETYQEWRNPRDPSPTSRGKGPSGLIERGTPQGINQDAPSQLSDNDHQDRNAILSRRSPGRSYTISGVGKVKPIGSSVSGTQATPATEARRDYQRVPFNKKGYDYVKGLHASPKPESPFIEKILNVLGSLGDLQAITSLGIIISGIANRSDLTFYHEQLVLISYMMALNSFWAIRINYMNVDSKDNEWRLLVRRVAIFICMVLAIYYQTFVYLREGKWQLWPEPDSIPHNNTAGYCYRFMDRANPDFSFYFWVIGQGLFAFALALCLFPCTRRWNEGWFIWTTVMTLHLWGEMRASWDTFLKSKEKNGWTALQTAFCDFSMIRVVFYIAMVVLWFLLVQLLAIWSYGDGFYPLNWFCYLAFLVWNTFDLISLVALNYQMVEGNELTTWGFGQVLPVVVAFLSIIYSLVDEFTGQCNIS
jgi:hypothetical protein